MFAQILACSIPLQMKREAIRLFAGADKTSSSSEWTGLKTDISTIISRLAVGQSASAEAVLGRMQKSYRVLSL